MAAEFDAIVIGSGFGGAMAALPLVRAGWRVLMLERGDWLRRGPQNWRPESVRDLSPQYDCSTAYAVTGEDPGAVGGVHCVGGASVFYGGVSLRYRTADFLPTEAEANAHAFWPYVYDELEPHYSVTERLLGICGEPGGDPTEPPRSLPYAAGLPPLSRIGRRVADAAERAGYHPFRLPLAINYRAGGGRNSCVACSTCDCYPCAVSAKNDVATTLIPELLALGLELMTATAVVRIRARGPCATGVDAVDVRTGVGAHYQGRHVIVAAGALATPHLLLASGLAQRHRSGHFIGRTLMRHANAVVFGVFPFRLDPAREFHKQIGINDFYFGHPAIARPRGRLGTIQQIHCPPVGLVRTGLPKPLGQLGSRMLGHMTGFIVIAHDDPQVGNRIELARGTNVLGMPAARVHHRYSARDRAARAVLVRIAGLVLREAGALTTFSRRVRTFSHALGTVRLGADDVTAPLDADGRLRGTHNVWVTDASALPTSASVNPSLTIAATALRTGCRLAGIPVHDLLACPAVPARKAAYG